MNTKRRSSMWDKLLMIDAQYQTARILRSLHQFHRLPIMICLGQIFSTISSIRSTVNSALSANNASPRWTVSAQIRMALVSPFSKSNSRHNRSRESHQDLRELVGRKMVVIVSSDETKMKMFWLILRHPRSSEWAEVECVNQNSISKSIKAKILTLTKPIEFNIFKRK